MVIVTDHCTSRLKAEPKSKRSVSFFKPVKRDWRRRPEGDSEDGSDDNDDEEEADDDDEG